MNSIVITLILFLSRAVKSSLCIALPRNSPGVISIGCMLLQFSIVTLSSDDSELPQSDIFEEILNDLNPINSVTLTGVPVAGLPKSHHSGNVF